MSELAEFEREDLRGAFFDWFGKRLDNARVLARDRKTKIEASLVLAAAMEAVSKFWAETFREDLVRTRTRKGKWQQLPAAPRFSTFLRELAAHDAYERVSLPILLSELEPTHMMGAKELRARLQYDDASLRVRTWEDDPTLEEATHVLNGVAGLKMKDANKALQAALFGQIIYREFRCCFVHEVQLSKKLDFGEDHLERAAPWYRNSSRLEGPEDVFLHYKSLVIPWAFLAASYETALNAFRTQCENEDVVPAVMLTGL